MLIEVLAIYHQFARNLMINGARQHEPEYQPQVVNLLRPRVVNLGRPYLVSLNRRKVVNFTGFCSKAFLWKANEGISMVEIIKRLEAQGLKVLHQRMSEILQNPFYCGMLSHSLLEGEIVEGKHEKLVSKELFLKGNGEKSKIPHGYKANPLNDELPLKLFFKCDSCKEYLRGYIVKAKGLYYYKCNHGSRCSCNVSAKQLHSLFETILNELNLTKEDVEPFKAQLRKVYNALNTEKEEHQQEYKLKVRELEDKIERLEERFINEEIKVDLYEKFSAKFRKEREELDAFVNLTLYSNSNLEKYINRSLDFLVELPSLWASSGYKEKQELQQTIFPEGIFYSKKKGETRTTKINSVFALIARQKGVLEEKETGISEVIFRNSGLVASTGIEPAFAFS